MRDLEPEALRPSKALVRKAEIAKRLFTLARARGGGLQNFTCCAGTAGSFDALLATARSTTFRPGPAQRAAVARRGSADAANRRDVLERD
jgi:hypothetical protein